MGSMHVSENVKRLRARYLETLLAETPRSVLDIGCGRGQLLHALSEAAVVCSAVDASPYNVEYVRQLGHEVFEAKAEELPFQARSHDWVSIRHVLHHLEDPAKAMREALRVARTGIILAEPCFDPSDPVQELSRRADRWLKGLHREAGMIHEPNLDLRELLALIPSELSVDESHEYFFAETTRPVAEFRAQVSEALAPLPRRKSVDTEYQAFLAEIAERGLAYNGSLIVTLRIGVDVSDPGLFLGGLGRV